MRRPVPTAIALLPGLRQWRPTIGLVLAWLLLCNLLVSILAGMAAMAVQADPLAGDIQAHLCAPAGTGIPARQVPPGHGQHEPTCPLCGSACPMGACFSPDAIGGTRVALPVPQTIGTVGCAPRQTRGTSAQLYPSDLQAQAPPRAR